MGPSIHFCNKKFSVVGGVGGVGWKSEFNVSSRPLPDAMSHWTLDRDRGLALDNFVQSIESFV